MDEAAINELQQRAAHLGIHDGDHEESLLSDYREEAPPAPKLNTPGIIATDITAIFTSSAAQLGPGELVKDAWFTLFESVGAIELMDPKMDTGLLQPGETMEDDYDVTREISPEECMGIMDQILCLETAWHMGHPLSQTLFTSMYIDDILGGYDQGPDGMSFEPDVSRRDRNLPLAVLMAYCLAVIKTCSHVNKRVQSEHFYEEEDFVTYTFNRSLLDELDSLIILDLIYNTLDDLMSTDTIEPKMRQALAQRLGFRAAFLSTISSVEDRSVPFDLKTSWSAALQSLPGIKSELAQAKAVPEAFSAKLQRRLASTVPPRPVVTVAYEEAYEHFERVCNDGLIVTEVLNFHDSHSLMNFVFHFQKRKPQPSVYIRTLLQHYLFGGMIVLGILSIRNILDSDMASITLPASMLLDPINDEVELPSDPRHKIARLMETFRQRAAQSYLDILRGLCQNRCRIRRTLTHTILDWDSLQLDSEELDAELREFTKEQPMLSPDYGPTPIHAFPLSSWCYHYKLQQMQWLVQMGFELDIYAHDERAGMYWLLQNLSMTHYRHLQRIRGFLLRDYAALKKSPKAENAHMKDAEFQNAINYVNLSSLRVTATNSLAHAISCFYTVLDRYKLVPQTPHPYATDIIRYEQRMKPFLSISLPELLPFADFNAAVTQPKETSLDLLDFAIASVAAAKREFEMLAKLDAQTARCEGKWCDEAWHKNAKEEVKSCIAASIALSTVKKAVKAAETQKLKELNLKVECLPSEKSYHDWWVIPKVVPPKFQLPK